MNVCSVLTIVGKNIHCNHHHHLRVRQHNHEIYAIIYDCLLCVVGLSIFLSDVQDFCARKACIRLHVLIHSAHKLQPLHLVAFSFAVHAWNI